MEDWREKVKSFVRNSNLRPSKGKGQSFLVDETVVQTMVEAAGLTKTSRVLEIGPGLGILTEQLLTKAGQVAAVELDKKLFSYLTVYFADHPNLKLLLGDVLSFSNQELVKELGRPYQVVANIPYAISGPIFKKFLTQEPRPTSLTLLVQKEVAERVIAKAGQHSLLSLSVQAYSQPRLIKLVPRQSFYPVPAVTSAILRLDLSKPGLRFNTPTEEKRFWQITRVGFSAKRKQLHNNLAAGLKISSIQIQTVFKKLGLNEKARAQELTLDDWLSLACLL